MRAVVRVVRAIGLALGLVDHGQLPVRPARAGNHADPDVVSRLVSAADRASKLNTMYETVPMRTAAREGLRQR